MPLSIDSKVLMLELAKSYMDEIDDNSIKAEDAIVEIAKLGTMDDW